MIFILYCDKMGDIEEGKAGESEFIFLDFTEDDIAQLSMTLLMGGQMSRKDKIKEGIFIAKEEHNDMADKVMAMLYTLADKFLDGIELDEIKEAMVMTRLGQMILDDGIKIGELRGREAGINEGSEETQKRMDSLINILLTSNRTDDCLKASKDAAYRKKLMDELGIK